MTMPGTKPVGTASADLIALAYSPLKLSEWYLLPNLISITRIVIIIPTVILFPPVTMQERWVVVGLLIAAYLSDMFDGLFARKFNQRSKLGLVLDPLADKLWTIAVVTLLCRHRDLPEWVGIIIIVRDLALIGFNAFLLWKRKIVLPSDFAGKFYMVLLGLMIILLTLNVPYSVYLGYVLVFLGGVTAGRYYLNFKVHF